MRMSDKFLGEIVIIVCLFALVYLVLFSIISVVKLCRKFKAIQNGESIMTREDKYLLGCLYAIHRLQEKGSTDFDVKIDGEREKIPWSEVCRWIEKQYGIETSEESEE